MFRKAVVATALLLASSLAAREGPPRAKIYGVAFVRLKSSDFQKASETCSKILGFDSSTNSGANGCANVKNHANHQELGVQNHFCLGVHNMQKAIDQLPRNGLAPDSQFAHDKPEIGRDGKWQYDVYDPDLTRIELMEPAPAKDPCCSPYTAPHPKL